MDYFKGLLHLLQIEKEEDRRLYREGIENLPVAERRAAGLTWFPIAIRDTETGRGDYLTVEVERASNTDIIHQLRFGMSAALFSNYDAKQDRVEGVISYISGNRLKLSLRVDELPDWTRNGKLGIDAVFDENSYAEMEKALKLAPVIAGNKNGGELVNILAGNKTPSFYIQHNISLPTLNELQNEAVNKILSAEHLAIVHGPPGTGKTTTLVQAIKALYKQDGQQVLVVAPSNAAVDLLSEKLNDEGLNVVRIGNPARVNERQMELTLDSKISAHTSNKEIKKLKKQAAEYRDLAHKYKRSFGAAEREQRKALFTEARNISKEVERTELYIIDDILAKAQVITATLVGANHYNIKNGAYKTVVIDEAGQAIEPACWIPVLKAQKLIMAGDHCQLPPTIKSTEAAKGLSKTLMEKCVENYPEAIVLLQEQYRMHKTIMGFSSKEFYNDKLIANSTVAERLVLESEVPLQFIDTAGCGYDEKIDGTGISNPEEGHFLVTRLVDLVNKISPVYDHANFPSVAIISPYKHQVEILRTGILSNAILQPYLYAIAVNTIDSFQGQERDVVFISMVRSNADNNIGFLSEIRRMNVAMTRARKKLVVIGDSATLSQFGFYADFIDYAQNNNGYVSAWEFLE